MRKIIVANSLLLILLTAGISPLRAQEPADSAKQAEELAARQRVVREGQLRDAVAKQDEGKALFAQRRYQEAIAAFEQALALVPPGPKAEPVEKAIRASIADTYATMAEEAGSRVAEMPVAERTWDEAIALARKALSYNPADKEIKNLLAELEDAKAHPRPPAVRRAPRPDETPERVEERINLNEKLRVARIQLDAGYLDEAEKTLNEVLLVDKYNIAAYHYLRKIHEQRLAIDDLKRKVTSTKFLEDIDRSWSPKIEKPRVVAGAPVSPTVSRRAPTADMLERLNKIQIDEVNFREADIRTVAEFLSEQSRIKDPVGVNIIVRDDPPAGRSIRSLKLRNIKLIEVLKVITDLVEMRFVIEPNAVVIVSKESTYGMEMETRTYPVDPTLILRVVTPNLAPIAGGAEGGAEGEGPGLAAAGGVGAITVDPAALADFFKSLGVPQPIGSSVKYLPPLSRLVVTNTPANLETLERLLNELNVGQNQVEIETKFLEASESTLRELGFQWYLGEFNLSRVTRDGRPANQIVANPGQGSWPSSVLPSGRIEHGFDNNGSPTISGTGSVELGGNPFTPGAQTNAFTGGLRDLSIVSIGAIEALLGGAGQVVDDKIFSIGGVLTNPQFQVIVKALSQNKRTDLLSSPRVTTLLGQPASIKIVTEFIYPTRFREPQAVAAAGGVTGSAGVAVTPSTPTSFATREVGVLLTVTPVLGTDGYTINLTLNPEVSEFLGFIDYGGRIQIPASGSAQGFVEVDNKITQPIFATRSVVTNVAIWDGQTVVLGGLAREDITEINDKVPFFGDIPFVGRLFRSKGKSVGKRNLIIFVTATLIDPAGNRIHPEGAVAGAFVPGAPVAPGQ